MYEDVLITCGSVCQINLSMCSKAKGWRSCLHFGWLSPHEESFHATFPFFNVGICFKDAPELFAALCTCFLWITVMTISAQLRTDPLWSEPGNLHLRCPNIWNSFHLCRLSADCLPDVFLVLVRPTFKPDLQCHDADGVDKVIYILKMYSFHKVTSLALFWIHYWIEWQVGSFWCCQM